MLWRPLDPESGSADRMPLCLYQRCPKKPQNFRLWALKNGARFIVMPDPSGFYRVKSRLRNPGPRRTPAGRATLLRCGPTDGPLLLTPPLEPGRTVPVLKQRGP